LNNTVIISRFQIINKEINTMKNLLFLSLFLLSIFNGAFSQNETALVLGNREISLGEFERLYKKNNTAMAMETQDLNEYLERFINFKLKVIEAENLGNDTTESFLNEFHSYRKELAKPYMVDSAYQQYLLEQAYNKLKYEVNASHILVNLPDGASPQDTLAAWEKIMDIRKQALKGVDFGKLAEKYSDDPSAQHNKGNLGWFGAFRMVPEFEETAFATDPGQISNPVRTRFGYHLIQVSNKRPAAGSVLVSHIFIRIPETIAPEEKKAAEDQMNTIYYELQAGADFAELAYEHSDDRASAEDGGTLPWFSTGMMIPEFENAAFSLKNPGDLSKPFNSFYGLHIIKLLETKTIGTFEEEKAELINKLNTESYNIERKNAFIEKLKTKHNYIYYEENYTGFHTHLDSSFLNGSWTSEAIPDPDKVLFSLGETKYTRAKFGKYLVNSQNPVPGSDLEAYIAHRFRKYTEEMILDYEESTLADRYEDFKYILQEYHDGILLFDLTDKKVWSKAVNDTTGLEKFFRKNKKKYNWEENRVEAYIIQVNDSSLIPLAKDLLVKNAGKKGFNKELMINSLCPDDSGSSCLDFEYGIYEKGRSETIDKLSWEKGWKELSADNEKPGFVYIVKIHKPGPKKLEETRGLVISDYQDYLEKEWVKQLRKKYPVTVNHDVIARIK
jgi:peptidyl-prolyl cis-trans isomerase SurA